MRREEFFSLPPISGSNFARDYGFVDYRGKVVLDVGADYGSTAAFFLRKGASNVIAVEGNTTYFQQLAANVMEVAEVIPVYLGICSADDFEFLISTYQPYILKVDCEGCELHLLGVKDKTFLKVPEYLLEIHTADLWHKFKAKFEGLGYTITHVDHWTTEFFEFITGIGEVRIVHAVRFC